METTLVLDDTLLEQAHAFSGDKPTNVLVNEALRVFVQMQAQERLRGLRGTMPWDGDIAILREQRDDGLRFSCSKPAGR